MDFITDCVMHYFYLFLEMQVFYIFKFFFTFIQSLRSEVKTSLPRIDKLASSKKRSRVWKLCYFRRGHTNIFHKDSSKRSTACFYYWHLGGRQALVLNINGRPIFLWPRVIHENSTTTHSPRTRRTTSGRIFLICILRGRNTVGPPSVEKS